MELTDIDKRLLMELEYNFPFNEEPFTEIASKLGITEEEVINRTKALLDHEIIKRLGMYVNFRAKGMEGALIAAQIPVENLAKYRRITLPIKELTHNYVRNHPKYNIWFVLKAENKERLRENVDKIIKESGGLDYVILYSKKTLKLSVKYDVIRGVSYSEPSDIREKVPTSDELGIPRELLNDLSIPLQITKRPFKKIAEKYNMKESELVELIKELKDKNVVKDYGVTLNGEKIGIKENAMLLINSDDIESSCYNIAKELREATHVVLREANKKWDYLCYAMIHARDKRIIFNVAKKGVELAKANNYMLLFSLDNLKPGIVI